MSRITRGMVESHYQTVDLIKTDHHNRRDSYIFHIFSLILYEIELDELRYVY